MVHTEMENFLRKFYCDIFLTMLRCYTIFSTTLGEKGYAKKRKSEVKGSISA